MVRLNGKAILFLLASCLLVESCAKEGCTDSDSLINYDPGAKKDNGTCEYKGEVTFWFNQTTSQNLIVSGIGGLSFYLGGENFTTGYADDYFTAAPDCAVGFTVSRQLGGVKTESVSYSIRDQNNDVVWSGKVEVKANQCNKVEVSY